MAAARAGPERTAFVERFVTALPAGGVVVDAGCGPGLDLETFRSAGLRALGVDASAGMVVRARQRAPAVVGDLRRLPVRAASLDGLWASASLLHVPRAQVPRAFAAWARALRPGGVLGLITALGDDEGWEAVPYAAPQHRDVQLRRWFVHHDRAVLEGLLRSSGFELRSVDVRDGHRRWLQLLAVTPAG